MGLHESHATKMALQPDSTQDVADQDVLTDSIPGPQDVLTDSTTCAVTPPDHDHVYCDNSAASALVKGKAPSGSTTSWNVKVKLHHTDSCGQGVYLEEDVAEGQLLLRERPLFCTPRALFSNLYLLCRFLVLSEKQRRQVWQLCEGSTGPIEELEGVVDGGVRVESILNVIQTS
jgi:hypothetical protein